VSHPDEVTEVPFDRPSKRASMLGCITASRTSLKPMMIMQRSTAEPELFEVRYTPDQFKPP
jgi:hypothetical protein